MGTGEGTKWRCPNFRFGPRATTAPWKSHLPRAQTAVLTALTPAQKDFNHDTLRLHRPSLEALAAMLVEFAEDLHCDIGIWRSLERYNTEFFGTPLPFLSEQKTLFPQDAISPSRLQHFLWILYPQFISDLLLCPGHTDLVRAAQVAAEVLQEQFADLPKDSGVKLFLGTPNKHGWEVKRKLVWLGTRSYLFRIFYQRYVEEQNAELSVTTAMAVLPANRLRPRSKLTNHPSDSQAGTRLLCLVDERTNDNFQIDFLTQGQVRPSGRGEILDQMRTILRSHVVRHNLQVLLE